MLNKFNSRLLLSVIVASSGVIAMSGALAQSNVTKPYNAKRYIRNAVQSVPVKTGISPHVNKELNLLGGPLTVSTQYSDLVGVVFQGQYAHLIGKHNALSLIADYGPKEWRANLTYAVQVNAKNRFKLTYEYLAQDLVYNFAVGKTRQWIGQSAVGGDYDLLLNEGILHSLSLSGNYVAAGSKNLATLPVDENGVWKQGYRHIAGGGEAKVAVGANLLVNHYFEVTPSINYSMLKYKVKYVSNENAHQIGYGLSAKGVLTPSTELQADFNDEVTSNQYSVGFNQILDHTVVVGANFTDIQGRNGVRNDQQYTVSLSYPAPKQYTLGESNKFTSLLQYVSTPAVYETQVLTIADQKLVDSVNGVGKIPSQTISLVSNPQIQPINTVNYIHVSPGYLTGVHYTFTLTSRSAQTNYIPDSLHDLNIGYTVNPNYPFNAQIKSTGNIPAQYIGKTVIVDISAVGLHGNKVVTQAVNNSFELHIVSGTNHHLDFKYDEYL